MTNMSARLKKLVFKQQSLVALLLLGAASAARAGGPAAQTDCVGYYTLEVPGQVEYAVHQPSPVFAHPNTSPTAPVERSVFQDRQYPRFADGLVVWDAGVSATSETTKAELEILAKWRISEAEKTKNELLRDVQRMDDRPFQKKQFIEDAAAIRSSSSPLPSSANSPRSPTQPSLSRWSS